MNPVFVSPEGEFFRFTEATPPLQEVEIPEMDRITQLAMLEAMKQSTNK